MALSQEERKIVEFGKENGKTREQVLTALGKFRKSRKTQDTDAGVIDLRKPPAFVEQFVRGATQAVGEEFQRGAEETVGDIKEQAQRIQVSPTILGKAKEAGRAGLRTVANVLETAFGAPFEAITGGISEVEKVQQIASQPKVSEALDVINKGLSSAVEPALEKFRQLEEKHPELAKDIQDVSEVVLSLIGEKPAQKALEKSVETVSRQAKISAEALEQGLVKGKELVQNIRNEGLGLLKKDVEVSSVDDLVKKVDEAPADIRVRAEAEAPRLSVKEKLVDISPDVKKRISGKQDKLRQYFDVAHARNLDDTLPTPFGFAKRRTQEAVDEMETLLNQTGSKIGETRQKLATVEASIDRIQEIEKTFVDELSKLNLEINNGVIRQKPGTVTRVGANGDIKALNDLYKELRTVKQNPNLEKIIDLRSLFDSKIRFGKEAREVSNSVDPASRRMRKQIADTAADIVGKSEAQNLKEFSEFMDALNDLRSYTDRRAGGEYLLRLVLSGRGEEARVLIDTIKQHTGIDLMDDALMARLATDLIGNERQKNLFRQEVASAGIDAARALQGDPTGVGFKVLKYATDKALDSEKIFLKAAK